MLRQINIQNFVAMSTASLFLVLVRAFFFCFKYLISGKSVRDKNYENESIKFERDLWVQLSNQITIISFENWVHKLA